MKKSIISAITILAMFASMFIFAGCDRDAKETAAIEGPVQITLEDAFNQISMTFDKTSIITSWSTENIQKEIGAIESDVKKIRQFQLSESSPTEMAKLTNEAIDLFGKYYGMLTSMLERSEKIDKLQEAYLKATDEKEKAFNKGGAKKDYGPYLEKENEYNNAKNAYWKELDEFKILGQEASRIKRQSLYSVVIKMRQLAEELNY